MAHSHVDAGGNRASLADIAAAFGFRTSTFAKILKCDERAILPISAVAEYLEASEEFVLDLLNQRDRAISSDDAGRILHWSRPTVIKRMPAAARLPQGPDRFILAYSLKAVRREADHQRNVAMFGEVTIPEAPVQVPGAAARPSRKKKK